jgi:hypothetical protein
MTRTVIILLSLFCLGISSDVGVTKIFRPSGIIPPDNYTPRVQLKNNEGTSENFWVFFTIRTFAGSLIYSDSVYENLTGSETKNVYFSPWNATLGLYISRCSLYLATDINPANDTLSSNVKVENLVPGEWILYDSVPLGLSGKNVKAGGGLADGSTRGEKLIYVLKGNKTPEFYLYDVIFKTWETKCPVPTSPENPTKHPKKGACMYREGDYIYLARGNNTFEFWAYYIPDDSWTRLKDIPLGIRGKKPKDGTSLAKGRVGNQNYLFLTKGKTQEFYAYDMDMDTWIEKSSTPFYMSESKSRLKHGSCLVDDGEDLYLLKDKVNLLYFYDCDLDSWYRRESLPHYGIQQRKKKVKKGAAMYYKKGNPNIIYALKGGCNEFWCYDVAGDSWIELPSIPREIYRRKVKDGGDLMMTSGCVFALKGGNTREIWRYVPIDTLFANNKITLPTTTRDNQQAKSTLLRFNQLRDLPNENLLIFDAVGRKINISSKQNIMQRLKPGIYFLSTSSEKGYDFRKVVILR